MNRPRTRRSGSIAILVVLCILAAVAAAATVLAATTADNERKLNTNSALLDRSASLPNGEKAVVERLAKSFNLPVDRISALREKSLGYGEIAVTLTMSEKMPGGLTEQNISKVVTLRQSHKGWGEIARTVNVKLPSVANRVDTIEKNANRDVKKASAEKPSSGQGAGGGQGAKGRS